MLHQLITFAGEQAKTEEETEGKCDSCSREAKKYCSECRIFKCSECPDDHDDLEKKNFPDAFIPVDFGCSSDDPSVSINCRQHNTEVEHICCGDRFICPYCLHRGPHSKHKDKHRPLSEVEKSLKTLLQERVNNNLDFEIRLQESKRQIASAETSLDKELAARKVKCLTDYNAYLDREGAKVKKDFQKVAQDYLAGLNSVAYFQRVLPKEGFPFLLERNEATKRMESMCTDDNRCIPGTSVALVQRKEMDGSSPFGSITTLHCSEPSCKVFRGKFNTNPHNVPTHSVQSMADLLQEFAARSTDAGQCLSSEVVHSVAEDQEEVEEYEEVPDHRCRPEKVVTLGAKKVKKTMHCTFEIQNVSKVSESIVYSHPVMMLEKVSWKAAFSRSHIEVGGEKTNFASLYLVCDYKGGDVKWSCSADVTITLKKRNGTGLEKTFSHTFKDKADGWGYPDFIPWSDICNPDGGYLTDDALLIETIIASDVLTSL